MVGRKGGTHNRPGHGNVQRLVDSRGYVTFRGRITRDGRTHYATAAGAGIPGRFAKRAWAIVERQAHDRARAALDGLIRDLDQDRVPDGAKRRATLADWLAVWKVEKAQSMRDETHSWRKYERVLGLHVEPFVGGVRLAHLGPARLLRWRQELLGHAEPRSPATVNYAERVLRQALRDALIQHYPVDETVLRVKRQSTPKAAPAPSFTVAQVGRVLDAAPEPRRTFYLTLYHGVTRFAEARGLRVGKVYWSAGQLDIAQQLPLDDGPRGPKWGSSGVVDVPRVLLDALRGQVRRVESALGRPLGPDDYVFLDPAVGRVRPYAWWSRYLKLDLAAAGLPPGAGFHAFRHGAGDAMAEVEGNPLRIQERMRHKSLQTTERYMQRRRQGLGKNTARKVAQAVERGRATADG